MPLDNLSVRLDQERLSKAVLRNRVHHLSHHAPVPPRHVQSAPVKPQASLSPYGALPKIIVGAQDTLPENLSAYAPGLGN